MKKVYGEVFMLGGLVLLGVYFASPRRRRKRKNYD